MQRENEAFKQTIEGMQAVDDESLEEVDDEEYMRMRYFEAMRRAQYDQMMRVKAQGHNPHAFRTPQDQVLDYEAYYSYGSEGNTASANYRPRNSNTMLRKPKPGSK